MKKLRYIIAVIILIVLFVSNTSEQEFQSMIDNSKDPESEFYMERLYKNAKPIIKTNNGYFSPIFELNFTNLGIVSFASLNSGWMGTLRIDGERLEERANKQTEASYLFLFGKAIELSSSSNFE
ncbi:hypothetical protein [Bizionia sp.]|uniref:hypothetical protein n=1 Tax=Bizionia sp. TaxID=1954480 RepID=UPI003A91E63F